MDLIKMENGEVKIDSRMIAEHFGKRHDNVMKDIRLMIKKEPELSSIFLKQTYVNLQNKSQPCYELRGEAQRIMEVRYTHARKAPKYETMFFQMLDEMFQSATIHRQLNILNYKVDFYIEETNTLIEYDEPHHAYTKEDDAERISIIRKELMRKIIIGENIHNGEIHGDENPWLEGKDIIGVVRVKQGEEVKGLRDICRVIEEKTLNSPAQYM